MRSKKQEKKEFDLDEAFVLWYNTSKEGNEYLKGKDLNGNKILGFYNKEKTNEKQPDIQLYQEDKKGNIGDKVVSLWINKSKEGKEYLTGETNESEKIVAFFGKEKSPESKIPYITGYFKED